VYAEDTEPLQRKSGALPASETVQEDVANEMGKKKASKVIHNCIRIERLAVPVKTARAILQKGIEWDDTGPN
jgi:hypothetical protein